MNLFKFLALLAALIAGSGAQAGIIAYTSRASFEAALTSETAINFEGCSDSGFNIPNLCGSGVGASTTAGTGVVVTNAYGYPNNFLTVQDNSFAMTLNVALPAGINAIGMDISVLGSPSPFQIRISPAEVAAGISGMSGPPGYTFLGLIADHTFALADISMTGAVGMVVDNFSFGASPLDAQVPEPAALALLGIGLAGLGFGRRKRA